MALPEDRKLTVTFEQIEESLERALPGGEIDAALSNKANKYIETRGAPQTAEEVRNLAPGMYSWVQTSALPWQPAGTPSGALRILLHAIGVAYDEGTRVYDLRYVDGVTTKTVYYGEDCPAPELVRWSDKLATTADLYHPNLLDNWYFIKPINQRGKTVYTVSGYTVDRWLMNASVGGKTQISIVDGGIDWDVTPPTGGAVQSNFSQIIPPSTFDAGTYTFSVLYKSNATVRLYGNYNGGVTGWEDFSASESLRIASYTMTLPKQDSTVMSLSLQINSSVATHTHLVAAKLDIGTMQTLARQDTSGNWVLNDPPPDPATELMRCQRYLFPTRAQHYFSGSMYLASEGVFLIPTPCQMRITPSLVVEKPGQLGCFDGAAIQLTPENYQILGADAAGIKLAIRGVSGAKAGAAVIADAMFLFSAEL